MRADPDPHWDWVEVIRFGDPGPRYIKGPCRHLETVPVESVEGEVVARLCLTCDRQLPPSREASLPVPLTREAPEEGR